VAGSRRTRVLYVHHRPEVSGASRALALLVGALDRGRFEPHALSPAGPTADLLRAAGAHVHEAPVACFTHIWASTYHGLRWGLLGVELSRLPAAHARLSRVLRAVEPDVVHLNDSPLVHAAWAARRRGVPVVWHLRSALATRGRLRAAALRRTIRSLAAQPVAINEDVAESFGVDALVVPDPVDLSRFTPGDAAEERIRLGLPPDRPVVSLFGYLYPAKGFPQFLEAAALLRARGVEARYLVVGGGVRGAAFFGSRRGRLLERAGVARNHERDARLLAERLGIADVLRFVPYVGDPAPLYRASDLVVAPSRGPELGLPAIEAAATGIPVVATGSRSGAGILVPGETGVLVPGGSSARIAEAVADLLADADRRGRMGREARLRAERLFDPEQGTRSLEAVYDAVAAGAAGAARPDPSNRTAE
jgi:glycosyltransferase involved in cell wall biosynthesis